jgi:aminopeptidase YwaD
MNKGKTMKKIVMLFVGLHLWTTFLFGGDSRITVAELKKHVEYLASDAMQGRKPGTLQSEQAAQYIAHEFKKYKMQLLADKGMQKFSIVVSVKAGDANRLEFGGRAAKPLEDFTPLAFSCRTGLKSAVVFAGFGLDFDADTLKWRDYDSLDVRGRWVMILREAPDGGAPNSGFEPYVALRKKTFVARDRGAAGVLFVSGEKTDKEDDLLPLRYDASPADAGIPVLHIKRRVADSLLTNQGWTVAKLESKLYAEKKPYSFLCRDSVQAFSDVILQRAEVANVVALLPGHDPLLKNEYIVIGAHYDHLGLGGPGSGSRQPDTTAVHNGADDNASGVAAVLELAQALAADKKQIARSLLFVAFTAEEMGTLGSKYFVENPPVPVKQIKYMINLDMVGRMKTDERSFTIGGSGTAAGMEELLNRLAQGREYSIKLNPEGYGPSDHASFYSQDIPVLFFMAGMHEDYHTPLDDSDRLNYQGHQWLTDYVLQVVRELSRQPQAMVFTEAGPKSQPQGSRRFKVTFGIMPDFSSTGTLGVRAEMVMPNRPASRAGMLKGDVIVAIEGKPVKDIYEYMHRLGELRLGDRVSIEVMRNGKKEILIVQL